MSEVRRTYAADFLSGCLNPQAAQLREQHRERIRNELREFLSAQEAQETAQRVYDLALEVDEEIGRIVKDPDAGRLYEYDGKFFTPRGTRSFHTAFDGLHLLKSLNDSILGAFICGRDKPFAIRWLLDELGKHVWVARRRRMNWEASGTLGLVPKEVLDAMIKGTAREIEADPPALSLEEQAFFRSFEEQMAER